MLTWMFRCFILMCLLCGTTGNHKAIVKSQNSLQTYGNGINRTICFHSQDANERGVEVATYDYADFTETILGHTSKILLLDTERVRKGLGITKYITRFRNNTIFYKPDRIRDPNNIEIDAPGKNLPTEARKQGCDFLYILKSGELTSHPKYPECFNEK